MAKVTITDDKGNSMEVDTETKEITKTESESKGFLESIFDDVVDVGKGVAGDGVWINRDKN